VGGCCESGLYVERGVADFSAHFRRAGHCRDIFEVANIVILWKPICRAS